MASKQFQVLSMTTQGIADSIKASLRNPPDVEDYTFEERYCRGVERVIRPKQDELDRLHFTRLESIITRTCNVFEAFRMNCVAHPRKVAAVWYEDAESETVRWTYADLWEKARSIAKHLSERYGVGFGDRVLMVYEPCIDFFPAFWALVGLGAVAVPVCPPDPFSPTADATDKLLSIAKDAEPKLILTSRKYKDTLAAARTFLGAEFQTVLEEKEHILDFSKRTWVSTDDITAPAGNFAYPPIREGCEDDIVFLQYTSGSTGGAKGVMVQHKTLVANCMNCALLTQGMGSIYTYQFSLGVSWLPTFHDMGLIGFHVAPVVIGGTMIYFSPINFIQNPIMWLQIISKYRHVSSGAPPFALDLCARRVTPRELQTLDLSGLEILVLGAEPIRASYMEEFARRFTPYGFNPKAYMTCYGMAENVLHVAGKWSNQYEARKILVDSALLNKNRLAVYRDEVIGLPSQAGQPYYTARRELLAATNQPEDADAQWLVSSGELIDFTDKVTLDLETHTDIAKRKPHFYRREVASHIAIVNPDTLEEVPDGTVGEIWIASPSRTAGYWNKGEVNERNFKAVLRKTAKKETEALLEWGRRVGRYMNANVDYDSFTEDQVLSAEQPVIGFLRNCVDPKTGHTHWMRSGDMGVIYDKNIFITGRIKDMIIIRGQNYYADDLEHCITSGNFRGADVSAGAKTSALSKDTSLQALSALRPGSAIAYSITIVADGGPNCPAAQTRTEGEHLAVVVELRGDPNEDAGDSDSENEAASGDDDDGDGDDGSDSDGNSGKKAGSRGSQSNKMLPAGLSTDRDTSGRIHRKRKHGNQMPLWQQMLMRYGAPIVAGMSQLYDRNEQAFNDAAASVNTRSARRGLSCTARSKLLAQQGLILAIKTTIDTVKYIHRYLDPNTRDGDSGSDGDDEEGDGQGKGTARKTGDNADGKEKKSKTQRKHRPMDADTRAVRARYSDEQIEQIASAIRRAISIKFMLIVGQITFISPKTIKKTSSGKKRRSDTTKAIDEGFLDHRIVKRCYSKAIDNYLKLKANGTTTAGAGSGISRSNDVSTAAIAAATAPTPTIRPTPAPIGASIQTAPAPVPATAPAPSSSEPVPAQGQGQGHFGGTVGVSLAGANGAYAVHHPAAPAGAAGGPDGSQAHGQVYHSGDRYALAPLALLPPRPIGAGGIDGALTREEAWAAVEALRAKAAAMNFAEAKNRILHLVVSELREAQLGGGAEEEDGASQTRAFTKADLGENAPDLADITIEYLEDMARQPADVQQRKLDEFGLDSMTGFKLAKSLAREFDLPASMMGPHLFLQDPTIDGMVGVMVGLVRLQASRAEEDFHKEFDTTAPRPAAPAPVTGAEAEAAAAAAYRATGDPDRVPYIMAIGTAVPRTGAPQMEVLQAMLPAMRMDARSEERFIKIGQNSGVHTRYSVLDSLDDLFWGRDTINSGSDEYVDARQEVYKREAVRLSIQSSIDCVHDWVGARKLKTDEERDAERLETFLDLERRHNETVQRKEAERKAAEAAAAASAPSAGGKKGKDGKKGNKGGHADEEEEKRAAGPSSSVPSSVAAAAGGHSWLERPRAGAGIAEEDFSHLSNLAQSRLGRSITHVVAVTCTGVIVPGLEFFIMQALGLPTGTQRLSIQFMGCFGAISGIRCASALAAENPRNRVLVVCTELCTLHMQLNDRVDNLIATALFADGSGAFIVGCAPTATERPLYAIHSCSSHVIPNTLDQMAWEMTKTGLHIGLAKEIAGEIFTCIGDFVDDMLRYSPDPKAPQHRVRASDCNCAIHPGGPLIVNTIQNVLGIDQVGDGHGGGDIDMDGPTAEAWRILRDYGNMSSATLVFVLDRIREHDGKRDRWTPTIAFGPGLNVEGALLKACFPGRTGTEKWQQEHGAELNAAIAEAKKASDEKKAAKAAALAEAAAAVASRKVGGGGAAAATAVAAQME